MLKKYLVRKDFYHINGNGNKPKNEAILEKLKKYLIIGMARTSEFFHSNQVIVWLRVPKLMIKIFKLKKLRNKN